ncbi:hypothetical protein MOOR_17810 [Moorella thermoacetica]|uniref:DUF7863 domain-containing protein n=1 Tax=Neomoorella thermoacetica TaxID=1525 RepID=A0A1J5JYJ7_NEOTH|nr:BREX-4 system phosphatase PglZ [Moorella thermoacetica]OIQ08633.1 hypothetical protein MOOR_17810 [Moorella thermoacetica]
MINFNNADDLIAHLQTEIGKGERFATRFILVQGCRAWEDLLIKLTCEVDRVVHLSEFCSGPDVFPNPMRLYKYLKEDVSGCRSVLLIPLAECIRLDPESAEMIRFLAEWPAEKIRRLYIPLLSAEEFFFPEMKRVSRYVNGLLPDIWSLRGEGNSEIIIAPFSVDSRERPVVKGIKEYLSQWERGSVSKVWLVTDMAAWLPVRRVWSECRVQVYPSSFDYVYRNIGWEELKEEWGSPADWEWLADQIREGENFEQVARRLLKVASYNTQRLFTLWQDLNERERWLVWLWSKTQSSPGSYLHHVLRKSNSLSDFSYNAIMSIFALPRSLSFSRERKELLERLGVNLMPPEFWIRYRELDDPLDRVAVLTDLSLAEREQLVLCVGELLTGYSTDRWWDYLEVAFSKLTWYLQPTLTGDEFADTYFFVYNRCRLKDRADEELTTLVSKWANQQLLWRYPTRSDLIARQRSAGAKILWVDAMGAEWMGLLTRLLTTSGQVECEVIIARANLPTITEANREWEDGEEVMRGLDDIAHHYAYQFPQSYLKAMEVIGEVAYRTQELLSQCPVVVITSDHGLSRFAATSEVKVEAPEGAKVEVRGRYASLQEGNLDGNNNDMWVMEERTAYLLTHNRFEGCSASRGEVHSGATPEECLTPMIIVRKVSAEAPPRFELVTAMVKLNARDEGILTVKCNRKVDGVELRVAGRSVLGQSDKKFTWSFPLKGWKAGKYTGKLYSASKLVGEITFEVIKGIIEDDLGL